ncbi:nuclease-related domain-containing protein [Desulfobacterota bacterium M19]
MNLLIQIIPSAIFITFCALPAWLVFKLYDKKIDTKKSPLNIDLLRSPGESLQEQIDDINRDISLNLLIIPIIPVFIYSVALSNYFFSTSKTSLFQIISYSIFIILSTIYFCHSIYKLLNKKNLLRLGLECEVAVGQDLQNLIRYKFKVYNDFQTENFNIDHIVIGPTGVFAIETKGRSKFAKHENNNWKLEFDGQKLIFPGWIEAKPVEQALRQADWLKNWLRKATAENVNVKPVLAIPGWYITRKAKSNLLIYNGKNSTFLANGDVVLSDKQIQTISFQIEKECRNISAKSYKKISQPVN